MRCNESSWFLLFAHLLVISPAFKAEGDPVLDLLLLCMTDLNGAAVALSCMSDFDKCGCSKHLVVCRRSQYANAQQTPVTSLTARSQLCRKCGSPLNQRTCANVHIAWLSRTSSERLSKKLPASFSGPSSHLRGESAAGQKQKNKVVAVRVCVVSHYSAIS